MHQQAKIGTQANRGKERQHHRLLQGHIEADTQVQAKEDERGDYGKQQPANHRNRNIVIAQKTDSRLHRGADEQHGYRSGQRLRGIQAKRQGLSPIASRGKS